MSGRPKGFITNWSPTPHSLMLLGRVQELLVEYEAQRPLSVRQIFYLLVGRNVLPKAKKNRNGKIASTYDQVQELLVTARRARRIPMEHIRDDTADLPDSLIGHLSERALAEWLIRVAHGSGIDLQKGQDRRLLLWSESAALKPQLQSEARRYDVHVIAGGGYDSLTAKHEMASLLASTVVPFLILHIGDLDEHGQQIYSSVRDDVDAFLVDMGAQVEWQRL